MKKEPYIIGETAYNHEGDLNYLYRMVDEIAELELNAIKFHLLLNTDSYIQKKHPLYQEIKKWLFTKNQWRNIIKYSINKNLDIIALCDDIESIKFINHEFPNIFALELHASSLNDFFLLNEVSNFKRKIILGIGGSTIEDIHYAVDFLTSKNKNDFILMYGFQNYPTNYIDINLSKMLKIRDLFNLSVGYADHSAYNDPNNEFISCMAAMMGFNILEKHYTPEYGVERIDYHAAVGKKQMKKIKELMKLSLTVFGSSKIGMSDPELKYGNTGPMKKAIVAKKNIKKGEKLSLDNMWFKRTVEESSIKQNMFITLLGLETIQNIQKDEIIDFSKIKYGFNILSVSDFTNIYHKYKE